MQAKCQGCFRMFDTGDCVVSLCSECGREAARPTEIPKPYKPITVRFTTGGRQCQVQSPTCRYGARDSTEAKTWADRLNDAYAAGWVAALFEGKK